ncbi:MAG: metallophosphoesterase [Deltaproteobacteria bacterium]|nr:metallophosphoesterase [Deltaproteobacteria bacterium]
MKILDLDREPFYAISFLTAAHGGGVVAEMLPFLRGRVDVLPDGVKALLVTSDLQGVASHPKLGGETALLGEVVAEVYAELADEGTVTALENTGVLLAGDYYSTPGGDKRGASGDVRDVWLAFAAGYRWVAGVAGNHDQFGAAGQRRHLECEPNAHLLDNNVIDLDGLRVGGVGLIPGRPEKEGRRDEAEFYAAINMVVDEKPDVLVLHQGPRGRRDQPGDESVRDRLQGWVSSLTICGHSHWNDPLGEIEGGPQILNVDARVVILTE